MYFGSLWETHSLSSSRGRRACEGVKAREGRHSTVFCCVVFVFLFVCLRRSTVNAELKSPSKRQHGLPMHKVTDSREHRWEIVEHGNYVYVCLYGFMIYVFVGVGVLFAVRLFVFVVLTLLFYDSCLVYLRAQNS